MPKVVYEHEVKEEIAFARKAAAHFAEHPDCYSFTEGEISESKMLALRWGVAEQAVLVLYLDEFVDHKIYANMIHDILREKDLDWDTLQYVSYDDVNGQEQTIHIPQKAYNRIRAEAIVEYQQNVTHNEAVDRP